MDLSDIDNSVIDGSICDNPYVQGQPPFVPSDLGSLVGWWDAGHIVGNDGDPVSSWTDDSTDGNTATQATANNKPTLKLTAGANSLPAVKFDRTSHIQYLSADTAGGYFGGNGGSQTTIFLVAAFTDVSPTDQYTLFSSRSAAASTQLKQIGLVNGSIKIKEINKNNAGTSVTSTGITDVVANQFKIWAFRWDSSFDVANLAEAWQAGTQEVNQALSGNFTLNQFTMGADNQNTTASLGANALISEIILANTNLSNSDVNKVGNYLANKYNLIWNSI